MAQRLTTIWPPLPPRVHLTRAVAEIDLPYPLGDGNVHLLARARHGLLMGLPAVGVVPGSRVLMPAWHHGSEVQAVHEVGATSVFYDVTEGLGPDPEQLESLLTPEVSALHLTHFLGFPQNATFWRAWCDQRGLSLVEDVAQGWLATEDGLPVGRHGDLAVWCLYKMFGLPDGAAIRGSGSARDLRGSFGLLGTLRRHGAWAAQHVPLVRDTGQPAPYDSTADFAMGRPMGASAMSCRLLPRVTDPRMPERRRSHYRKLLDFGGRLVPEPFDTLPDGACPFTFPIAVRDKPTALTTLRAAGIKAVDFWSVPHHLLDPAAHPRASWLRRHVVVLPVHQELSGSAMDRMAGAMRSIEGA